jgi:predicted O-methyltransferase YrrM
MNRTGDPNRKGYFIPYRYADEVAAPVEYPALAPFFEAAEPAMREQVERLARHRETLAGFAGAPPAPRWDQDWFPRLDGAMAYVLVRDHAPARIVEIGSGHSTRFMARAIADGGHSTSFLSVDPQPRATIDSLPIERLRATLQQAGPSAFEKLDSGDILFVDSSHVLMPGSDVDLVLNQILPRLSQGVMIHFHDIFLPSGYPEAWAWRGYNEQNVLAGLLAGGGYDLLWSSAWAARKLRLALARSGADKLPLVTGAHEASIWLRKR